MVNTEKYVRKPLFVDAVQVTAENMVEISEWCQGEIKNNDGSRDLDHSHNQHIHVRVHNPKNVRQTKAFVGDWLLYTERGYKVYTQKAFTNSFDLVVDLVDDKEEGVDLSGVTYNRDGETVAETPDPFPDGVQHG